MALNNWQAVKSNVATSFDIFLLSLILHIFTTAYASDAMKVQNFLNSAEVLLTSIGF